MADQDRQPSVAALRKLEASVHLDLLEQAAFARDGASASRGFSVRQLLGSDYRYLRLLYWWMRLHKLIYAALDEPWQQGSIHELRINTKGTATQGAA